MAGYREKFIQTIGLFSNAIPTRWLTSITRQRLVVPVYHLVSDEPVDHIKYLYPVKSVKSFTKDLEFLLKNFNPIDYEGLKKIASLGDNSYKNSFILTFDDGLREFYDVVSPILLQKGIPAICFLNSDFIDNKDLFFRYKASLLINTFSKNKNLIKSNDVINWMMNYSSGNNFNYINKIILSVSYQEKEKLDALAKCIHLDFNDYLLTKKPYLTSEQINSLKAKGFYFGSHSCDHPEYQYLSIKDQIFQTKKSTLQITSQFSLNYNTFAFPFTDYGISKAYFEATLEKEKIVDLSFGCAGLKKEIFPNHLQRMPFEVFNLTAKEIVNAEYIYFMVKSIFGKNTIHRERWK